MASPVTTSAGPVTNLSANNDSTGPGDQTILATIKEKNLLSKFYVLYKLWEETLDPRYLMACHGVMGDVAPDLLNREESPVAAVFHFFDEDASFSRDDAEQLHGLLKHPHANFDQASANDILRARKQLISEPSRLVEVLNAALGFYLDYMSSVPDYGDGRAELNEGMRAKSIYLGRLSYGVVVKHQALGMSYSKSTLRRVHLDLLNLSCANGCVADELWKVHGGVLNTISIRKIVRAFDAAVKARGLEDRCERLARYITQEIVFHSVRAEDAAEIWDVLDELVVQAK